MKRLVPFAVLGGLIISAATMLAVTSTRDNDALPPRRGTLGPNEQVRQAIAQLAEADADGCHLNSADIILDFFNPYSTLEDLANDSDAIVLATFGESHVLPPEKGTIAGRIVSFVRVDEVLVGSMDSGATIESGARVLSGSNDLVRGLATGLDPCASDQLLLFLKRSDHDTFEVNPYGWVRLGRPTLESASFNDLFDSYGSTGELMNAVRQTVNAP